MTLSMLLEHAVVDLSDAELGAIGRGLALLGEHSMPEGEELDRLAAEILALDEAVDADTVEKYKAARASGKGASAALRHAKKNPSPKKPSGEDRYKKIMAAHPSLSSLNKTKRPTLGPHEKMVFGRVVKVAA